MPKLSRLKRSILQELLWEWKLGGGGGGLGWEGGVPGVSVDRAQHNSHLCPRPPLSFLQSALRKAVGERFGAGKKLCGGRTIALNPDLLNNNNKKKMIYIYTNRDALLGEVMEVYGNQATISVLFGPSQG